MRSTGSWYDVLLEDGNQVQARLRGKLRLSDAKGTNPVAVGDKVELDNSEEDWAIAQLLERTNYIVRKVDRGRRNKHVIAANLDQAVLIVTYRQPKTPLGFIDRFLVTAERFEIPVLIVLNKTDLLDEQDQEEWLWIQHNYEELGYEIVRVSATENKGLDVLENALSSKTSLVAGQSGVGKSSLLNALDPELNLPTGEISDYNEKGTHTTTFAQMFQLQNDIRVIDSPGIRSFSLFDFEPSDIGFGFREIAKLSESCKFNNCLHQNEPGCAVQAAAEAGDIVSWRWDNYNHMINDLEL